MAGRRKKRRKRKSEPLGARVRDNLAAIDWSRWLRASSTMAWSGLVVLLIAAWWLGVPRLRQYAARRAAPLPVTVRFVDAPAWTQGELESQLALAGSALLGSNPLLREDLVAAREALLRTGWFDDIQQIRRVRRDLVEIDARFVVPYALVRDRDGDHLVDPSGTLLPRSVSSGESDLLKVVVGAFYPRPEHPGAQWKGADVSAALQVLRIVEAAGWRDQVTGIDVSRFHEDQVLELHTRWGHPILWGSEPGRERGGEVTVQRKLSYLDHLDEHFGRIDGGHDGPIDITHPRGVFGR
jgi:hypothetical protein